MLDALVKAGTLRSGEVTVSDESNRRFPLNDHSVHLARSRVPQKMPLVRAILSTCGQCFIIKRDQRLTVLIQGCVPSYGPEFLI